MKCLFSGNLIGNLRRDFVEDKAQVSSVSVNNVLSEDISYVLNLSRFEYVVSLEK